jgi:hypothetical protein
MDSNSPPPRSRRLAIATPVGSFKGAFSHGVLTALEEAGVRADGYAAASSSVIPAAWAAVGQAGLLGAAYWTSGWEELQHRRNMSKLVQRGIRIFAQPLRAKLYAADAPTFYIATNAVTNPTAAAHTQTPLAHSLGKKLLLDSVKKDRSWVDNHLEFQLFSTRHHQPHLKITRRNFPAVAYASSRVMHAWDIPAWIDGKPFVDAAYTCLCPAMAAIDLGYQEAIAISNEPGPLYQDMFHIAPVPASYRGAAIHIIRPDVHLKTLGVDFTQATPDSLRHVYDYGKSQGERFLSAWR